MAWPSYVKRKEQSDGLNSKIPGKNKVPIREWTKMARQKGKKISVWWDGQEIEIGQNQRIGGQRQEEMNCGNENLP